jgi:hypothetical protein
MSNMLFADERIEAFGVSFFFDKYGTGIAFG